MNDHKEVNIVDHDMPSYFSLILSLVNATVPWAIIDWLENAGTDQIFREEK